MNIKQFKAIIMDFDGLMIDTEWPAFEAWQEIYRRYDVDLPLKLWVTCVGGFNVGFHPTRYLVDQVGEALDEPALMAEKEQKKAEICERMPLLPGVSTLLETAQKYRIPLAVVSSSTRSWVEHHLSRVGVLECMQTMVTREDVTRHKPDPMPYLVAAEQMDVAAKDVVVFEDSPNGVQAAKAAGMTCIAVPNRVTSHANLELADRLIESIDILFD